MMTRTCNCCIGLHLGLLGGIQGERLSVSWHHSCLSDSCSWTGTSWVPHGSVLAGVHVQQGVAGGLHQLHDVGVQLAVGGGGGSVQLLDVGTGGLLGNWLPGNDNIVSTW